MRPDANAARGGVVAANSARAFAAQVAGNGGLFVAVLLVARALAPAGRGAVAFLTVSCLIAGRLAGAGLPRATTVFVAQRPESRPALLANLLAVAGGGGLLAGGLAAATLLALGGHRPAGVSSTAVLLVVPGVAASALSEAGYSFLEGCGRFGEWALVTASAPWLYAALVMLVWATVGLTVEWAVLLLVVTWAGTAVALLTRSARDAGIGRPASRLLWETLRFGLRAWGGSLALFLNFRTDQILLGLLGSAAALGIYAVAVNASEVLLYLPAAIGTALVPAIAGGEPALRVERTLRVLRSLLLVTLAGVAVAALAGPLVLPLVFGQAYSGSVGPLLWLLPGALGFAVSGVFSSALLASGAPGRSSFGPLVALAVGLVLDLVLIPPYGASGAAAAASAAFLAGGLAALLAFRGREGFPASALVPRRADVRLLAGLVRSSLARARASGRVV
jgi:O-antigen/teichoic acid export membrane protein